MTDTKDSYTITLTAGDAILATESLFDAARMEHDLVIGLNYKRCAESFYNQFNEQLDGETNTATIEVTHNQVVLVGCALYASARLHGVELDLVVYDGIRKNIQAQYKAATASVPAEQVVLHWVGMDTTTVVGKITAIDNPLHAAVHAALYIEAVRNAVDLDSHERDSIVAAFIEQLSS